MSSKTVKSPKTSVSHDTSLTGKAKSPGGKHHDLDAIDLKTEEVPVVITKRVNALKNVQMKLIEIESKFYEELHELECKYAKLYEPLFDKRKTIVTGEYEPTDEEGKWFLDEEEEKTEAGEEKKAIAGATEPIDESKLHPSGKELLSQLKAQFNGCKTTQSADEKGICNFWLETLQSFRITSELIQEHDEPILSFLQDIKCVLFDQKPYGYRLEFHFAENPYFTNKVLTKTYELKTDVDSKDPFAYEGPDLAKSTGCKIDWKQGKNVCVKTIKKKIKSKNKKVPPKVVTKEEKQDSFFSFFETPNPAKSDDPSGKQLAVVNKPKRKSVGDEDDEFDDEDGAGHEELLMMADFEIGQYLREKIVPKAILYYTGEYDDMEEDDYEDYDDEDEDDQEGDEDDDDDEDEDDDDDDDDDEDDGKKKAGNKKLAGPTKPVGKPKGGAKGSEPTPSECKQN